VTAWATVDDDYDPSNDTTSKTCECTYEILYDDGNQDIWGYVSSNFYDNAFAVRFTPVLEPPFAIERARVYVYDNSLFALTVNADTLGLPGKILAGPDTLSATVYPGWAEHDFDNLIVEDSADFWVLFHWMSYSPYSPYVGWDGTDPIDMRSYWYWAEPSDSGWHAWTTADFMIRATVAPYVLVEEDGPGDVRPHRFFLSQARPNPLQGPAWIEYGVPACGEVRLMLYDASGRLVRELVSSIQESGIHRVLWDLRDRNGRRVSGGVYFSRIETDGRTKTRKLVVIR
jgi:hypothetical protein